ncbi:MAG TPA: ATP-binding protein [Solirubrobacteraceae bacterium]|nr:ATP-binding protein [Solirubrobacteraceae bacterium]
MSLAVSSDCFAFLDARLRGAVEAAVARGADPQDALRGLYISDEQALAMAASGGSPAPVALSFAAERLGLDPIDAVVLAMCAAPELDPRFGRLYAYLHDDVTRKLASPRLAADLLSDESLPAAEVLARFAPGAPLTRRGAVRMLSGEPATPLADRQLKVADRLAAFLLGAVDLADAVAGSALRHVSPDHLTGRDEATQRLRLLLAADTRLPLVACGPDAGAVLSAAAGAPVVLLGARELERVDALADARLAAALEGGLVCLDGLEDLSPVERGRLLRAIDESPERIVLVAATRRDAVVLSERTALVVDVPLPGFAERRRAWESFSGSSDAGGVAAKFRLSIEQIRAAGEVSVIAARSHGESAPRPVDLDLGARHASSTRLGELATRLEPSYAWNDLVLADRQLDVLQSISAYLRHRDRVLSEWGYEATVSRTQGLKVLFAGESGTGKTMAAQVLGAELGLEMFRVDLAGTVSKYIGETEKNLERIFAAADGSNAILFFDEADALFGKRSEVSDSHDRYANLEVAYLLQRMEAYPGAVILATNFRRNIDDAFIRRLDFVIDFPFPEVADRRRIWERVLPPAAPVGDDVELDFLAARFKLSGGAIRNCSLAAAFNAADEGTPIEMRHLVRAVAQEYAKQGRLTLEADFERFHAQLRSA